MGPSAPNQTLQAPAVLLERAARSLRDVIPDLPVVIPDNSPPRDRLLPAQPPACRALFLTFLAEGALRLSAADPEFARKVQAAEEINRKYGNAIRALIRR